MLANILGYVGLNKNIIQPYSKLANILGYVGLNKNIIQPYSKLAGEILAYIFFIKNYIKDNRYKLKFKNTLHFKGYVFIAMLIIGYIWSMIIQLI